VALVGVQAKGASARRRGSENIERARVMEG
jgi:hypothetical protein